MARARDFLEIIRHNTPLLNAMWAALGLITLINVFVWLRFFQPAPYTDMVDLERFLGAWSLADDGLVPLIKYPDNEHRAFAPVVLQAIDNKLFASTGLFLILIHIGCFAALAAACARHGWLAFGADQRLQQMAAAAMVFLMLWSAHWNNIIRTKQTHVCLSLLFMAVALWIAARLDVEREGKAAVSLRRWPELACLSVMIVLGAWSFTAGLAVIPALLIFAVLRRWGWPVIGVIGAASAVAIGGWMWASTGGPTSETPSAGFLMQLGYFLNLVGGPFHRALAGDQVLAPVMAFGALVAFAWLCTFCFRESSRAGLDAGQRRALSFFCLLAIWAIICALSITLSRAHFGPGHAFVKRYLPFGLCFISASGVLLFMFRQKLAPWPRRISYGVAGFYLFAAAAVTPRGWLDALEHHREIALGAVAASLNIRDAEYTLYPARAKNNLPALMIDYQARDASFFRRDWGRSMGADAMRGLPAGSPAQCTRIGGSGSLIPIGEGAYRVAAALNRGPAPLWLVVLSSENQIVGLARKNTRFETGPKPIAGAVSYAGFARLDVGETARLVALVGDHSACPIADIEP